MPLKQCSLGKESGWKWGDSGKCYKSKKDALKQGIAIEKPAKFKKIMQTEGCASHDWALVKAALDEYEKESKAEELNSFKSVASFLSAKADDGDNDTGKNLGDMLDDNKTSAKKVVEVDDAGPSADSDTPGNDDGNEFNKPGQESKADSKDGDGPDTERDLASLDTPTDKVGHSIVPPYNKEASPETDPSQSVPNVEPPSREEVTAPNTDGRGTLDTKVQYETKSDDKKFGMDDDCEANVYSKDEEEATEASEKIWLSIAYVSQKERDAVPEEDFAGPHKSFPIRNSNDVKHAAHLIGHGANPTAIKRKIIEIARRKGLELPESWKLPDEKGKASIYDQALALFSKLSDSEKKTLKAKLEPTEMAVNGPCENN